DAFIAKPFTPEKIGAALADLRGSLRSAASVSVSMTDASGAPPAEFDLQMLRFLADETAGGLRAQIDRYLAAFGEDRVALEAVLRAGNPQEIHRLAHRLVGHASAIKYDALVQLARDLQARSAAIDPAAAHEWLVEFDREFARLREKLASSLGAPGSA
ncbi:MAG TPA: Hpt domain-containing protein, partial [Opitutus sp.]|nr:Hpt domain-containing protein [Opitutus sp.]